MTRCVPSCSASTATMIVRVRLMPIQNETASTIRNPAANAPSHTSNSCVASVVLCPPNTTPYTDDIRVLVPSTASVVCFGACHIAHRHRVAQGDFQVQWVHCRRVEFSGLAGSPSTGACSRAGGVSPRRLTGTRRRISPRSGHEREQERLRHRHDHRDVGVLARGMGPQVVLAVLQQQASHSPCPGGGASGCVFSGQPRTRPPCSRRTTSEPG